MNATPHEVISWIETELNDEVNFRDLAEIITEARARFVVPELLSNAPGDDGG